MNTHHKLLSAALAAALSVPLFAVALPTFAQDSTTDTETVAKASVPKERLVDRYSELAGSEAAADDIVSDLRSGGDFSVTTTETRPVLNADGTQATNPDGTPKTETVTVERSITNPNGPMGWGEVNITLGMAEKLVASGEFADLESALVGGADITNADGTVTAGADGILQLRADGMGWGQIAKEYGFKLGSVLGNGKASTSADTATAAKVRGSSERIAKTERVAKVERAAKIERPERVERPAKLERPERPQKPERSGRP